MKKILATFFLLCASRLFAAPDLATTDLPWVDAEVKKVQTDTQKITLKHADIPNLDMPSMTMVFKVANKAMLEKIKAGDKVKITVLEINGEYTVQALTVQ